MAALSVGLPPPAEVENHAIGIRPQIHRGTDELRAVVTVNALRQATVESQPLECGDDIAPAETVTDVDRQALACEQVQHGQRAESPTIRQLIGDKVHAPDVIASGRGASLLAVDRRRVTPGPLPSKREAFLNIEPIASLLPERPTFAAQQHEQSAIAKPHACLRELTHPLPKPRQRIPTTLVPKTRAAEPRGQRRAPLADHVPAHQVVHHFALLDGL